MLQKDKNATWEHSEKLSAPILAGFKINPKRSSSGNKRGVNKKDVSALRLIVSDEAGRLRKVPIETALHEASHFATISDAYAKGCPYTKMTLPWLTKSSTRSRRKKRLYPIVASIRSLQSHWEILPEHTGTVFIPPSYLRHPDLQALLSKPSFVYDFAASAKCPTVIAKHTAFTHRSLTYRDFPECPLSHAAVGLQHYRIWTAVSARYKRNRLLNALGHLRKKASLMDSELVRYEQVAKDWPVFAANIHRGDAFRDHAAQLIKDYPLLNESPTGTFLPFETPEEAFVFFDPILEKRPM